MIAAGAGGPAAATRGSLRRKLMRVVMASTAAALLLSATALLLYEIRSYREAWISDLSSQADLIAQSVAPTLTFDDPKAANEALAALRSRAQILGAAVFTPQGRLFASYQSEPGPALQPLPELTAGSARFEGDRLELMQRIEKNGEFLGTVFLRARHDIGARIVDYLWILALAGGAGLLVAALIFRQLHPAITRPILAMADVSRRVIENRDYELRVTERSDDEVGVLVDAFNNMLRDLSAEMRERHSAEEALRAADKRKDEFLATLAHELRNPLAPLATALAILKRADDNPKVRESTRAMMERQLAQMVRLIDDLLEVSRITRGKLELRREPVEVVAAVQAALEAAEPALQAKQHRLDAILPSTPIWVHADSARLTQVFVNLLHNAAKYTPAGGRVEVGVHQEGANVVVRVRDDGMGIDPSEQESIFGMFVQLDTSLGRGMAGLGVGLTIARQLVQMHGGTIAVESAGRGRGSTFQVVLPTIASPAEAAATPGARPAATGAPRRVLVADDNVDFANSLANLFRLEGHAVRVAHDGQAAVAAVADFVPDVAFLDIGMPGLSGYDVAAQLRAGEATRGVHLVAVTGWGQSSDKERARAAGFDHHLVKPIDFANVVQLLATLPARTTVPTTPAAS
ncbi:MAG TPA: ATP-binding protein [Caldimonas sp.]|jgi:signal transduction histidine kinase/CheY-like chemotaxis protein|nr:ATP-binding protein [Caldimonas sp.]HEX2541058.1 ATP-binding protein [Caldimonas sp.]